MMLKQLNIIAFASMIAIASSTMDYGRWSHIKSLAATQDRNKYFHTRFSYKDRRGGAPPKQIYVVKQFTDGTRDDTVHKFVFHQRRTITISYVNHIKHRVCRYYNQNNDELLISTPRNTLDSEALTATLTLDDKTEKYVFRRSSKGVYFQNRCRMNPETKQYVGDKEVHSLAIMNRDILTHKLNFWSLMQELKDEERFPSGKYQLPVRRLKQRCSKLEYPSFKAKGSSIWSKEISKGPDGKYKLQATKKLRFKKWMDHNEMDGTDHLITIGIETERTNLMFTKHGNKNKKSRTRSRMMPESRAGMEFIRGTTMNQNVIKCIEYDFFGHVQDQWICSMKYNKDKTFWFLRNINDQNRFLCLGLSEVSWTAKQEDIFSKKTLVMLHYVDKLKNQKYNLKSITEQPDEEKLETPKPMTKPVADSGKVAAAGAGNSIVTGPIKPAVKSDKSNEGQTEEKATEPASPKFSDKTANVDTRDDAIDEKVETPAPTTPKSHRSRKNSASTNIDKLTRQHSDLASMSLSDKEFPDVPTKSEAEKKFWDDMDNLFNNGTTQNADTD